MCIFDIVLEVAVDSNVSEYQSSLYRVEQLSYIQQTKDFIVVCAGSII